MPRRTLPSLRGLLALLGLLAAAALIWFVGPLIAIAGVVPLAGEPARWAALAALLGLALSHAAWRAVAAARRNRHLMAGLVAGAAAPAAASAPGAAEVALIGHRFEQAVCPLRRGGLG